MTSTHHAPPKTSLSPATLSSSLADASMSKERFFAHLKTEFFPRLRAVGFHGSGQNFRRIRGDVIHAVNIQGNKHGESCAVNLGIHLAFLPFSWSAELPDVATIKEVDCELRRRLASGTKTDHWWKYEGWFTSPEKSANSLIETFFAVGEPYFQRFSSVETILAALEVDAFSENRSTAVIGGSTAVRYALTTARIHARFGNAEACRRTQSGSRKTSGLDP